MTALRWLRARPTLSAALIYALLVLVFVGPALLPGRVMSSSDSFWFLSPWSQVKPAALERPANPEIDDAPGVFHPLTQFAKADFPDVPLWNPYIMAGRPLVADAQSGVFSPFNAPAYVLPFYSSLALSAALKLFLAAFGTFLLARALGMRFAGAFMAGTVYGFNLWLVTWLAFPHSGVWALVPWMLLLADRVVRDPGPLPVAGLAFVTAAQFVTGHPESSFHAMVVTTLFFLLRLFQARRRPATDAETATAPASQQRGPPQLWRPLLAFAGSLVLGAAVAAAALIPFGELLLRSADIHQRAGAGRDHVPLKMLIGLFLPDYRGKPTGTSLELFLLARSFYVGALALMLAAAALILRPRLERVAIAVFGFVCMAVVAGITPVIQLVTLLPGFSSGHNTRLAILAMLCLALLAGWGLDDLTDRVPKGRRARAVLAASLVLLAVPVVLVAAAGNTTLSVLGRAFDIAWRFATPPPMTDPGAPEAIRLASLLGWLVLAGAAVVLLALRLRGRLPAVAFATLAVLLAAADLFRAGMGYNPAIERRYASQPATGAIRYLEGRRPARFVSAGVVPENVVAMRFHLYEARGYDLPIDRRYDRLWRQELSPEFPTQKAGIGALPLSLPKVTPRRLRTLSLLGVADVMQSVGDPPLRLPGLRLAYAGRDARVYANSGALPRAFVVGAQQVVAGGDAALAAITRPGFDARNVVVSERPLPGLPRYQPGRARVARVPGSARIVGYEPDRVTVRSDAARAGLLVLTDNDYPGWKATVDGRPAPVSRVDYVFRGVPVPAGRHAVVFSFEPASWRAGWIVSLVGLCLLAALVVVGLRRRVRRKRSG